MIIKELKKKNNNTYIVKTDSGDYVFSEDVIIKYKLMPNKVIDEAVIPLAMIEEDVTKLYNQALNYAINYGKSLNMIRNYLKTKNASPATIDEIISRLLKIKIINDVNNINNRILTLIKKGNGRLLIKEKLLALKFNIEDINNALDNIDDSLYYEGLNDLVNKVKGKYDLSNIKDIAKLKRYLLSRGYTYLEIENVNIKGSI